LLAKDVAAAARSAPVRLRAILTAHSIITTRAADGARLTGGGWAKKIGIRPLLVLLGIHLAILQLAG